MRVWLETLGAVAGFLGAAGVALAAIGAHRSGDPRVTTAAYFLLFHAAALLGLVAIAKGAGARLVLAAASLLAAGAILFSGGLALHALAEINPVPLAAPTGGVLMILGWLTASITLPFQLGHDRSVS